MKKQAMALLALTLALTGCGASAEISTEAASDSELCAYLLELNEDTVTVNPVEYLESEDGDRLATLKHTEDDMPDGYYIYDEDETEQVRYRITDETTYSFLDWGRDFGGTDDDIRITTQDRELFGDYLNTYENGKAGMPFFFTLDGDRVVEIFEKPMA